jgi:hypothetical protein
VHAPLVDTNIHYLFFAFFERNIVWEKYRGQEILLIRGMKISGVSIVVQNEGCCQVTDGFIDDSPFKGAWCASKGEAKGHDGNIFVG